MKTIVIGLDGASFDLIDPWLRAGKLPNLQHLIEHGAKGTLESCLPPTSSPNWKCYSTGKNPGKLGIFWWRNIDFRNRRITIPSACIQSKEIWDYISEDGGKVGIINTPLTYPTKQVNGFMIAGGPDAPDGNYTYPRELESRLKREFKYKVQNKESGYKVHPPVRSKWWQSEEAVEEAIALMKVRFAVAKALAQEYELDFLHLTIFYINSLHHDLWDEEPVLQAWQVIDDNIGALRQEFKESNFIIMSDHGSNEIHQVFYINTWLEEQGYLKTSGSLWLPRLLYRLGLNEERLFRVVQKLRLNRVVTKIVPKKIRSNIPSAIGTVELEHKEDKVVWEKSKALASGQGPLYLAPGEAKLREEIMKKLKNLTNPLTGSKIARHVYRREEVYQGEFLSEAPDIIIDQYPHTHIRGSIGKKNIFEKPQRWRGENTTKGIFIASGPDFKEGMELSQVSILDLAPTILHQMGLPVPADMDGEVLSEIFKEGSEPALRAVKRRETEGTEIQKEKEKIRRKLKGFR